MINRAVIEVTITDDVRDNFRGVIDFIKIISDNFLILKDRKKNNFSFSNCYLLINIYLMR